MPVFRDLGAFRELLCSFLLKGLNTVDVLTSQRVQGLCRETDATCAHVSETADASSTSGEPLANLLVVKVTSAAKMLRS